VGVVEKQEDLHVHHNHENPVFDCAVALFSMQNSLLVISNPTSRGAMARDFKVFKKSLDHRIHGRPLTAHGATLIVFYPSWIVEGAARILTRTTNLFRIKKHCPKVVVRSLLKWISK
jgi:hypothetical protein